MLPMFSDSASGKLYDKPGVFVSLMFSDSGELFCIGISGHMSESGGLIQFL